MKFAIITDENILLMQDNYLRIWEIEQYTIFHKQKWLKHKRDIFQG